MPARRPHLTAAVLLATALSCGGETSVLLSINGTFPTATKLSIRLVGIDGPLPDTYPFPETGALDLPGSVLIKTGAGHVGVYMWATDADGRAIAWARSNACMPVSSGVQSKYSITLNAAVAGFAPTEVNGCACDRASPATADMCPPGGRVPVGGAGGTSTVGGAGGAVAPIGGVGGSSVAGVSGGQDAGVAGAAGMGVADGGAGMGVAGMGVDAAPMMPGKSGALWGFEEAGSWTATGATVAQDAMKNEGMSSLLVTPAAAMVMCKSRNFSTKEVGSPPTAKLGIDVWTSVEPGFSTFLALQLDCPSAGINGRYLGNVGLKSAGVKAMTWARVSVPVPMEVQAAFGADHSGCWAQVFLDNPGGAFRLDRLAFDN